MDLKEKLRIAGIRQVRVAEESGYTQQYVGQVLSGVKSCSEITNVASKLLSKEIESKPYLKTIFNEAV
jgi:hypothetical protein